MNNDSSTKTDLPVNNEISVKQLMKKFESSNTHKSTMIRSNLTKYSVKKSPYFGTLKPRTVVNATSNEITEHNINLDSKVSTTESKPLKEVMKLFGEPAKLTKMKPNNLSEKLEKDSKNQITNRKVVPPPVAPKPKNLSRQSSSLLGSGPIDHLFNEKNDQTHVDRVDNFKIADHVELNDHVKHVETTDHMHHSESPESPKSSSSKPSIDSIHSNKSDSIDQPINDSYVIRRSQDSHSHSTANSAKDEVEMKQSTTSSYSHEPAFSSGSSSEDIKVSATYEIHDYEPNSFDDLSQNKEADRLGDLEESAPPNLYSDLIPVSYNALRDEDGNLIITLPEPTFKSSIYVPKSIKKCVTFTEDSYKVLETYNEEDYERGDPDVDPVTASAEYELEKAVEKLTFTNVEITKDFKGLGLSIVGKGLGTVENNERLGIFVKSLTPGGAAENSGMVQINDQIIEVNGINLVGVSQQVATQALRNTSTVVKFVFGRKIETEE